MHKRQKDYNLSRIYLHQVECIIFIWIHDMYPNACNSLVNILNESTCATLSNPQLRQHLIFIT